MDCFDADVLSYAVTPGHPLGSRVLALLDQPPVPPVGSVLLLCELLIKPTQFGRSGELDQLQRLLARLEFREVDDTVAEYAVGLGAKYRLQPIDAVHLATGVVLAADRFITNNRRDFGKDIAEIDVTYPDDLPQRPL